MIKLVASDMDGTLLGADGKVSAGTADAVHRLQARDIRFLVCTGRGYADAKLPLDEAGICCDMICMNGAMTFDRYGRQTGRKPLLRRQVEDILECCRGELVLFDFMTEKGSCTISSEEEFEEAFRQHYLLPVAGEYTLENLKSRFIFVEKEEFLQQGTAVYKMSVMNRNPQTLARIREKCYQRVEDLAIASSHETNLEITHIEAQKGNALIRYAMAHGIKLHEIMALGDSENDRSMLSLQLGYTLSMENGMDSVKHVARCQTRSNERDGVAYAIETLVLSRCS